jgi:hypothetical protein
MVEHARGIELKRTQDVWPVCGEENCIAAEHQAVGRKPGRSLYTNEQIIGTIQTAALRLGHPPSVQEWREGGYRPHDTVVRARFKSWNGAIRAAGLIPRPQHYGNLDRRIGREKAVEGIRALAKAVGRPPREWDVEKNREWLRAMGFPTHRRTYRRAIGGDRSSAWPEIVAEALRDD